MRYPQCKSCWWWKKIPGIIAPTDIGICLYWRNKIKASSYCPDHFKRRVGNKKEKLDDWIRNRNEEINLINMDNYIDNILKIF